MASAGAVLSGIMWLRNSMITDGSHPSHMDPNPPERPGQPPSNRLRNSPAGVPLFIAVAAYPLRIPPVLGYVPLGIPITAVATLVSRVALRRWLWEIRLRGHGLLRRRISRCRSLGLRCPPEDSPWRCSRQTGCCRGRLTLDLSYLVLRKSPWDLVDSGVELVGSPGFLEVERPCLSIPPIVGTSLPHVGRPTIDVQKRFQEIVFDRIAAAFVRAVQLPLLAGIVLIVNAISPGWSSPGRHASGRTTDGSCC